MKTPAFAGAQLLALVLSFAPGAARAQVHASGAPADSAAHDPMAAMHHHDMAGMDMSGAHMSHTSMRGMYGPYTLSREASGTSWQPDAAGHHGIHVMRGDWALMLHGMADVVYDHQGGPRGDEQWYSDNMLMGMAQRPLGAATLGLRAMLSAEPATIGKDGYPLLLQTGETADGVTPLVDRQHPHDLFMELAASLSVARGDNALFAYGGLPGEPALGPPAFMHRFSAMHNPEAPITHHWLDSTHIAYGVLTAGAVANRVKFEASAFRGREPDENRWNIESPNRLDSHSFRLSANPGDAWALQISYGRLKSPEQLEPDVDQDRTTASALYDGRLGGGRWEALLAWGRGRNRPGHTLDAFTAEASAELPQAHTLLLRAEVVEKDELFVAPDPRAGSVYEVGELSAGYRYDLLRSEHTAIGLGVLGTLAFVGSELQNSYGGHPVSALLFLHAGLR
jgi:hypothetical protein